MVTCQSSNQLKIPAKVSWAFKMVPQFGSQGYTIMGKTADLTVVQKTIIDTLHKEGKPQTFIAKEAGCSQSAVSKHVNRELSGRKKCGRKRCTTNRENRSLMRIVKQNRFKNLGELHKEWTEAGVKASTATTHRRVEEFGYSCHQKHLTWAKEKKNWTVAQWSKVLFSYENKFCISFGNQGPRVWRKGGEAHSPSFLKSSVKFPQSVMIWGAMSSAGVGPLCFLKTNVTAPVLPRIFGALHASFCWPAFKKCWLNFPAGFGTCPHCQKHQKLVKWPWCWCAWQASKLIRPEPHRESIHFHYIYSFFSSKVYFFFTKNICNNVQITIFLDKTPRKSLSYYILQTLLIKNNQTSKTFLQFQQNLNCQLFYLWQVKKNWITQVKAIYPLTIETVKDQKLTNIPSHMHSQQMNPSLSMKLRKGGKYMGERQIKQQFESMRSWEDPPHYSKTCSYLLSLSKKTSSPISQIVHKATSWPPVNLPQTSS